MYNIVLPKNASSDCYDSIIYSILKYYNYKYELYNINYFYTDYYIIINNYFFFKKQNYTYKNILKEIFNIDVSFINRSDDIDIFKVIEQNLINSPVGIFIDPYYCYWSPFFNKAHHNHSLLIVAIEYSKKKYICFDLYYNEIGYVEVSFDLINHHYLKYFLFKFNEIKNIDLKAMIEALIVNINKFDDNIERKKEDVFSSIQDNLEVLFPDGIETSPIIIALTNIAAERNYFLIFLEYIEKEINKQIFTSLYPVLSESSTKFLILKALLSKYAMTGYINSNFLKGSITQIFDIDLKIIELLKKNFEGLVL